MRTVVLPRSLAATLALAQASCALVTDLGYEEGSGGGAASATTTTGAVSTGSAATSSTSSMGTGGGSSSGEGGDAASTTGATSSTSATGGGGSGGAGGAPGCVFPGAGLDREAAAWSTTLGPLDSPREEGLGIASGVHAALDDDRVVFVAAAFAEDPPRPILFGDRPVADGSEPAFLVGWIDDAGEASDAWALAGNAPSVNDGTISVAPTGDGKALVATSRGTEGLVVVEVDLCTREESAPLLHCDTAVGQVTADARDGRIALAFAVVDASVACDALPPGCSLPEGIGNQDTILLVLEPDGTCRNALFHDDNEGSAVALSIQNGVVPALADDGAVVVVGVYDGALFEGEAAIDTGEPYYYEDGPDPDTNPDNSIDAFHRFHARLEPAGDVMEVVDAVDLGRIAFATGGHGVVWRGDAAHVVGGSNVGVQPTGPFDPPLDPPPTPRGFLDLALGRFPTPGSPSYLLWEGGNDVEVPQTVSQSPFAITLGGWATSANGGAVGGCADPFLTNGVGGFIGGGCALFLRVDEDGGLVPISLIDAEETGAADYGFAALAVDEDDDVIVGWTDGTITLDRTLDAPPTGFANVYFARPD